METRELTAGRGERGRLDLAVVMPVYNEQDCIANVVGSWLGLLSKEEIRFRMIIMNDGSTDGTQDILAQFSADSRVEVVNKPNSGHGPTVLTGYAKAVEEAKWVFQCDSDNEISPTYFPDLWKRREAFDALFGCRSLRMQPLSRRIISTFSRVTVRLLFGGAVTDVNIPYRLIRSALLRQIVAQIPPHTFAPNVIVSGALSQAKVRIYNHPVRWEFRRTGRVSIAKWKLWKSAAQAFWQTLRCRPRMDIRGNRDPHARPGAPR